MSCVAGCSRLRAGLLAALGLLVVTTARAQGFVELEARHDGASDTIRLLVEQQGPQVHVTSPSFGSVVAGNVISISGTATDRSSEDSEEPAPLFGALGYRVLDENHVEISAGEAFVSGGRFTIPDVVLGSGTHVISIEAFDSAGIGGGALLEVTSDPSAPAVALVGPADGEAVLASAVSLDLNFAAPVTLLSVNGSADGRSFPAGLAEDAVTVALALGANVVTLELDGGNGPTTASFTIFRVASVEPIRIVDPPDGAARNTALVSVTVRAARGTPFVRINGIDATAAADGVTFTAEVPIRAGENSIEAVAFPFGQEARITVHGDFTPPRLLALLPPDGAVTAEETLAVIGFADEGASVELLGPAGARTVAAVLDPERSEPALRSFVYRFDAPGLPLDSGVNEIEIRLRDTAGNETTKSVAFERRAAALALTDPADGAELPGTRADVRLEAFADLTIEAWFAAGRELPDFAGIALAPGFTTFAGVPLVPGENEMRVVYRRPGGEPEVLSFRLISTAPPLAIVEGTVLDSRSGAPLAGALVEIAGNGTTVIVTTDAAGRFRAEIEPGTVTVSVRSEGFLATTATATAVAAATATIDLSLLPWTTAPEPLPGPGPGVTTSRLEGIVTDAAFGAPLPGVTVTVQAGSATLFATTDAEGFYAVEAIPAEPFTVAFAAGGFIAQVFEIPFETPVDWRLDAALEALAVGGGAGTSRLSGRVFDEDTGAGLAGAAITVDRDGTILTGASGPDGVYAIDGIPTGPFHVSVALEGFVPRTFDVPFEDAGQTEVDVGLVASGAGSGFETSVVRGTVTHAETGEPLEGALVRVESGGVMIAATTDAAGMVRIGGIPVGPFTITVTRAGFLPRVFDVATAATTVIPLAASLSPFGAAVTLVGQIVDAASGLPEAGVDVSVAGTTIAERSDENGRFVIDAVSPGEQTLRFRKPGFLEQMTTIDLRASASGNPIVQTFAIPFLVASADDVQILVPPSGSVTDWDRISVVGTVRHPGATVTVNGIAAEVIGNRFTARHVPLAMGVNTIHVTAQALGIPSASAERSIERSATPILDVALYSPPDGATVPGGGLVVRGWVSAREAITLVADRFAAADEGLFEATEVDVAEGSFQISALARLEGLDAAARDDVVVHAQTSARALDLTASPATGTVPFDTTLSMTTSTSGIAIQRLDFDLDGDRQIDIPDSASADAEAHYEEARPFTARVLAMLPSGVELSAATRVRGYLEAAVLRTFAIGNPVDLALGPEGDLYALDAAGGQVTRYDDTGSPVSHFGESGSGSGQLSGPQAFALAADGRFFVADTGNDRIQVFSPDGTWERSFGSTGTGSGQLRLPSAVAVDGDRVVVADSGNARIQVFDAEGRSIGFFPAIDARGLAAISGRGTVAAIPGSGLRFVLDRTIVSNPSVDRLHARAVLGAPIDVGPADDGLWLADSAEPRLVALSDDLGFVREVRGLARPARAVTKSQRREIESVFVADGLAVTEIGLPVPSPVPVVAALKDRLIVGDVEGALDLVHPQQRPLFRRIYEDRGSELASDAAAMQEFSIDRLRESRAIVRVRHTLEIGGSLVERVAPVHLVRAEDGTWQIFDY